MNPDPRPTRAALLIEFDDGTQQAWDVQVHSASIQIEAPNFGYGCGAPFLSDFARLSDRVHASVCVSGPMKGIVYQPPTEWSDGPASINPPRKELP